MNSSNSSLRRYSTSNQLHRRQQPPNQSEAIVDKLHGAIASLRHERDDLHRSKEVAAERLRLVKEERMNAENSVKAMQETYNGLMESLSDSHGSSDDGEGGATTSTNNANNKGSREQKEIEQLKQEVQILSREAKFEHAELVDKKQKVDQVRQQYNEREENRTQQLRMAREALRERREKMVLRNAAKKHQKHLSKDLGGNENANVEAVGAEKMRAMLSEDPNEDLVKSLPRLIGKAAANIASETGAIYSDSDILKRRIAGYERYINGIQTN